MAKFQVRQGDVLVTAVRKPRGELKLVEPEDGKLVLAHGEATGHSHAIDAVFGNLHLDLDGRCYLHMEAAGQLVHEEHGAIGLSPGWFEVTRQREYSPEAIRNVAD